MPRAIVLVLLLAACSKTSKNSEWVALGVGKDRVTYIESKKTRVDEKGSQVVLRTLSDYSVDQRTESGNVFRSYVVKGLYKCGENLWGPIAFEYFSGSMGHGGIVERGGRSIDETEKNLLSFEKGSGTEVSYNAACVGNAAK